MAQDACPECPQTHVSIMPSKIANGVGPFMMVPAHIYNCNGIAWYNFKPNKLNFPEISKLTISLRKWSNSYE